jgi:hypothetical protein
MVDSEGNDVVEETTTGVTVVDATAGKVQYDFQDADVDEAGDYYGYFIVKDASGESHTFPPGDEGIHFLVTELEPPEATVAGITAEDIANLAKSPRKVQTDEGTVTERSVDELIKADRYAKANEIGDEPLHGLRVSRFKPAGPV